MGTPFLGELRLIASPNLVPKGWTLCNGQLLPINNNQALFAILGTNYGGNGSTNFALPDLRGKVALHMGGSFQTVGQTGGQEAHTLTISELPTHVHLMRAAAEDGDNPVGTDALPGKYNNGYRALTNLVNLAPTTVKNVGGSQPHENKQPYLVLRWMICLSGIFPSRA